jgi:hypothetical protein
MAFPLLVLIIMICFPFLVERVGIIRKLNKGKFISCRIKKYSSLRFINPKKQQQSCEAKKLYLIYNLMTIILWIYWISFIVIPALALLGYIEWI